MSGDKREVKVVQKRGCEFCVVGRYRLTQVDRTCFQRLKLGGACCPQVGPRLTALGVSA